MSYFEISDELESFERIVRKDDGSFVKESVDGYLVQAPDIFQFFVCKNQNDKWEVRDIETGLNVVRTSGDSVMEKAVIYTLLHLGDVTDNEYKFVQNTVKNFRWNSALDKNLPVPSLLDFRLDF